MPSLVIAPHMDDEVLGCAGLLQRLPSAVVFCSEAAVDRRLDQAGEYVSYTGEQRAEEMQAAAGLLGYEPVRLRHPVHGLEQVPTAQLVSELEDALGDHELIAYPAESNDEDHMAVRRAVTALARPHRFAGTLIEYMPWGCLEPFDNALLLRLSEEEMDRKLEAMRLYATQVQPGGSADELYPYSRASILAYAAANGRLVHTSYAEAYVPRRIVPNETTGKLLGG